jgi:hypothetical protein
VGPCVDVNVSEITKIAIFFLFFVLRLYYFFVLIVLAVQLIQHKHPCPRSGMEPEGSLPHSQEPATCPYPKPDRASPCFPIPLLEDPF